MQRLAESVFFRYIEDHFHIGYEHFIALFIAVALFSDKTYNLNKNISLVHLHYTVCCIIIQ